MATVTPGWYVWFNYLLTIIPMILLLKQTSSEKNVKALKGWYPHFVYMI